MKNFTSNQLIQYSLAALLAMLLVGCEKPHLPEGSHVKMIELDGTKNFRDIGGYTNYEGKKISYGKVYRSDQLAELTEDDLEDFQKLGIKTIIDLRSTRERIEKPNILPENHDINIINMAITLKDLQPDELSMQLRNGELEYEKAVEQMQQGYQEIVSRYSTIMRLVLETSADEDKHPILIHCTAGKDRTGVAIATLMLALGIDREQAINDYLLTNDLVLPTYSKARLMVKTISGFKTDDKTFDALAGVKRSYLESSFEVMTQDTNSFGGYFHGNLGLPEDFIDQLRDALLE